MGSSGQHALLRMRPGVWPSTSVPIPSSRSALDQTSRECLSRGAVLDAQDFCGLLSASVQACLPKALAARILRCLERTRLVPHASSAAPGQRPNPPDHYASITVRSPRPRAHPNRITLVDDVITRGSSFVGMVPRIQEAFPDASVRCFALVRTISTGDVDAIFAPTAGTITYRDGLLMRQP